MRNIARLLFHSLSENSQRRIYEAYNKLYLWLIYIKVHRKIESNVRRILSNRGYKAIHRINVSCWKKEPILTQYYVGTQKGNRYFIKAVLGEDFGCIKREFIIGKSMQIDMPEIRDYLMDVVDYWEQDDYKIIVSEYVIGQLLSSVTPSATAIEDIASIMIDILDNFYTSGYIHGDIRPSNIVWLEKEQKIKLIDYGLSYSKKHSADDVIYKELSLPKCFENIGCNRYTPANGWFDDAYAILYVLKDLDNSLIKDYPIIWKEINNRIGRLSIKLSIEDENK